MNAYMLPGGRLERAWEECFIEKLVYGTIRPETWAEFNAAAKIEGPGIIIRAVRACHREDRLKAEGGKG